MADECDGMRRRSLTLAPVQLPGLWRELNAIASDFRPDWIAGFSDCWVGVLAQALAGRQGARAWLDAYDNFEAYMPWNLPLHWLWRRACAHADLVTAAGPQLAARLQSHRQGGLPAQVLPMAADPAFVAHDRATARARLGLPATAPLLGYAGSWTASRGTHLILDVLRRVRAVHADACLVLSGHPPAEALSQPGVIGVGYLPDAELPLLLSALDVACVVTANTGFGRFSYPAKLYEALACGTPVVASRSAPVAWILGEDSPALAAVGDADDFARRVMAQLQCPERHPTASEGWEAQAQRLRRWLAP
jgi:glycosyltransferase involved in cell wall biosynthesis